MIGGMMLVLTISAMLLILLWADKYDDLADSTPRGGFFAMTAGRAGPYDKRRRGARRAGGEAAEAPGRRKAAGGGAAARRGTGRREEGPIRSRSLNGLMHESEADAIAEEIAEAAWARETGARAPGGRNAELEEARAAFRARKAAQAAKAEESEKSAKAAPARPAPAARSGRDAEAMAEARRRFGGLS